MLNIADIFDLSKTAHAAIFEGCAYPWDVLAKIEGYLSSILKPELRNRCLGVAFIGDKVATGEGTVVEDGAMIKGPALIGRNCLIRHSAYIRENVIIGDNCVIGNSTELKNVILFDGVVLPHFNYVGDSVLGYKVHLGAGAIVSNLKSLPGNVTVDISGTRIDTGLRKFGAMIGDEAEIGANAVLNPGSIIGRRAVVYPCVCWRGYLPPGAIAKNRAAIEVVQAKQD